MPVAQGMRVQGRTISLKTRLAAIGLMVVGVSVWLLTLAVESRLEGDMVAVLQAQQFATASYVADDIDAKIRQRIELLEQNVPLIPAEMDSPERMRRFLATRVGLQSLFSAGIVVIGKDGRTFADYPALPVRADAPFGDLDWYREALATGRPVISKPRISRFTGQPGVAIAAPVRGPGGEILCVLVGFSRLSDARLFGQIERSTVGDGGVIDIASPRHRMIVTSSDAAHILQSLPQPGADPLLDRFLDGFQGSGLSRKRGGGEFLASAKAIASAGWIVHLELPAEEAFQPIRKMERRATVTALALTLLAGLAVWLLVRRALAPLGLAAAGIRRMAEGDSDLHALAVAGDREVRDVLSSVNTLVGQRRKAETASMAQMALARHHHECLRTLNEIAALPSAADAAGRITEALELGAAHLGLPIAFLGRGAGWTCEIALSVAPAECGIVAGQDFAQGEVWCGLPHEIGEVLAVHDLGGAATIRRPACGRGTLAAFIGAPVRRRGEPYGSVNFASPQPFSRAFDEADREFVSLFARWIGSVLDRAAAEEEMEAALAEAESARRRTNSILASAGEGIVGLDVDGRIGFINPAARRMLGWGEDEGIGAAMHERVHHHHADGSPYPIESCPTLAVLREGGRRHVSSEVFWRPDGTSFPVDYTTAAIVAGEAIKGAVIVFRDVGERLAAEAALAASNAELRDKARQLTAINAELEQFAAAASHDLRQPLRMVSSYLGLIERRFADGLDPEAKDFLGFAIGGARRMEQVIVDLLDYARTGRTSQPFQPVPLADLLDECRLTLQPIIAEAGADLVVAGSPPIVLGDRGELGRLLQNLIGNAAKYRAPERPLRITVSWRRVAQGWELAVGDNGIGIAPEDHERAFGIFQRLGGSGADGCGIGLAICKKIVEHHGGRIWIESALGLGSTFFFTLPGGDSVPPTGEMP